MSAIIDVISFQSLVGHTTPIECVRFGQTEELVVAGSASGALKIWDLEAAKLLKTLTGHKAGLTCADFHPYGDFLASGSADKTIKLWDVRRKGCIFTYKGHANRVNSIKFSPDGQWIASAGEDAAVRVSQIYSSYFHRYPVGQTRGGSYCNVQIWRTSLALFSTSVQDSCVSTNVSLGTLILYPIWQGPLI